MTGSGIDEILVRKRAELDALEMFSRTPAYARLLHAVQELVSGDIEPWLVDWLIQPSLALGAVPLIVVEQPDGVEILIKQLHRAISGVDA